MAIFLNLVLTDRWLVLQALRGNFIKLTALQSNNLRVASFPRVWGLSKGQF